jgi:hypothetical protein
MKLTAALLIFMCVTVVTIHLAVTKKIDVKVTVIFLAFAIAAGLAAANYDMLSRLKLGHEGVELETAKREIGEAKSGALAEIDAEVKAQKDRLDLVIRSANDTREKLEQAEDAISTLIDDAEKTGERLREAVEMAKPPTLSLSEDPSPTRRGDNFEASFVFAQSKAVPPGVVAFQVRADVGVQAQILAITADVGIKIGRTKSEITQEGKMAVLIYQPIGATVHRLELVVSGPTAIEISGSHVEGTIEYSIGD